MYLTGENAERQLECISQYIEDMPTGKPAKREQSLLFAKFDLANKYTPEQLEQLEYQYQQHLKYGKE